MIAAGRRSIRSSAPVRGGLAASVLLAAVALGGCGSLSGSAGTASAQTTGPAASSPATTDAGSAGAAADPSASAGSPAPATSGVESTPSVATAGQNAAPPLPAGDGAAFAERLRAAMTARGTAAFTMTGDGASSSTAKGVIQFTGAGQSMSMSMLSSGKTVQMVILPDAWYINPGSKIGGKSWIKITEKGKDPLSKAFVPLFATMRQQSSPAPAAAALKGVPVTTVPGQVDVDGVRTVRYVLKQNSKQMLAAMPAASRAQAAKSLAGASSVTTYYVDDQNLVRKIVVVTTIGGRRQTTTMLYRNWGDPVSIVPPSPSDIASMPTV